MTSFTDQQKREFSSLCRHHAAQFTDSVVPVRGALKAYWWILLALSCVCACQAEAGDPITIQDLQRTHPVSFEKEILPILRQNCLACHSSSEEQGSLVLESPQSLLKGGDSGPGAIAARGAESLIVKLAAHQDGPVMPPEGNDVAAKNLSSAELGLLKLWIDQGAKGSSGIDSLSPKQWQPLPPGVHPAQAIALSEDGQFVACSRANQIYLYHVPTGQLVTKLSDETLDSEQSTGIAHRDMVQSLAFNVDGDMLASGGFREVKLWRRPEDVQRLKLNLDAAGSAVAVSPDKQWIAVGTEDHQIQLFSSESGEPGSQLAGHTGKVTGLRFTPEGQRLISGSSDGTVRIWDVADGTPVGILETPAAVNAIELVDMVSDDEERRQLLVTGDESHLVKTWELPSAMPSKVASGDKPITPSSDIVKMATSQDGTWLALLRKDNTLEILALSELDGSAESTVTSWKPDDAVISMSFVPGREGGEFLMTATAVGSLQTWSLPDHALVATWFGNPVPTTSTAASSDGKQAATGHANGAITLWDIDRSGFEHSPITVETNAAVRVAKLSPTRKLVAVGGLQDGKPVVFIRNIETGNLVSVLRGHAGAITSLSFSANESRLASGSADKTIRVWDLGNAATPQIGLLQLDSSATTIAVNVDGTQVLAGFEDKAFQLHQLADGEVLQEFSGHNGGLLGCGFLGAQPFSIASDKSIRFWNAADGTILRTFSMPTEITCLAVSDDQARMAFGCADNQVRVVQADNGAVLQTLQSPDGPATAISFSPQAKFLSILTSSGAVSILDVETGDFRESILDPTLTAAWFETDPSQLAVGTRNGQVSTRKLRYRRNLISGTKPVNSMIFQNDGLMIFMADADGGLRGFNTETGQQAFSTSHGSKVNDLAISPDQKILATAGENGVLKLWQPNGSGFGPSQITGLPGPVQSVAFSADSKKVIASIKGDHHAAHVFDVTAGSLLQKFSLRDEPMIGSISLPLGNANAQSNPEGEDASTTVRILTVTESSLHRWEATAVKIIAGHSQPVTSLAADPGRPLHLFSGSLDGSIRCWNLGNGQSVQQISHGGPVASIAISPDGQRLASASENQTAKLFRMNGQLISEMRGDLRLQVELQRRQQESRSAAARLVITKRLLEEAEKDVPKKTEAEKTLSDSLAAANKEVTEKQAKLTKANAEKIAAEKKAIEASSAAKLALAEKEQAELLASNATAAMQMEQDRLSQLQAALRSQPDNEEIKQLASQTQQAVTVSQRESQRLTKGIQAPTKKAAEMSQTANNVAKVASDLQKPYNDAANELKVAESAQNLISQQHAIAAKELKDASDLVPIRKASLDRSEAAKDAAEKSVTLATEAAKNSERPMRSVVFSPDGSLIATAGDFSNFHTWDGATGKSVAAFGGHEKELSQLVFLDDATIVSASIDQSCRVWEANPSWVLERTIGKFDNPDLITHRATAVDFNRESTQLIVASGVPSRSGELYVFEVNDGSRTVYLPQAHDDVIYAAKFSPDGKRIASGGADRYLRTFDVSSSTELRRFEGHTNYVLGVSWKSDGETIATSSADNTIKIWQAETGDQQRTINQQLTKHVTGIQFIGDSENVVSSSGDKRVRIHNGSNGGVARSFPESSTWLHCVSITPDSSVVAAGDASGNITIWNGTNGQELQKLSLE